MGNRWAAGGCKCCPKGPCGCTADFPSTLSLSDGLGTTTLTRTSPTSASWTGTNTFTSTLFEGDGTLSVNCVSTGSGSMPIGYGLTFNCPNVSFPHGRWTLVLTGTTITCSVSGTPSLHYGKPGGVQVPGAGTLGTGTIDFTCDVSMLVITLPTVIGSSSLAMPGGGGGISITP